MWLIRISSISRAQGCCPFATAIELFTLGERKEKGKNNKSISSKTKLLFPSRPWKAGREQRERGSQCEYGA
jgi:hypothetical protein